MYLEDSLIIHYFLCLACQCDMYYGSRNEDCNVEGGQCECKTNYAGRTCEECHDGYYNYPDCDSKCLIMKIVCLDTSQICGKIFIPHLTNFLVFFLFSQKRGRVRKWQFLITFSTESNHKGEGVRKL